MFHAPYPAAQVPVPQWTAPDEARRRLNDEIDGFVSATAYDHQDRESEATALALRVTAGLGKTGTALRCIARHAAALLARGHVLVYVPTLDLAERAQAEFAEIAPGVPSRVVRGRDAVRPDDRGKDGPDRKMCERAELAHAIARIVPSVTQALCRARDPEGNFVQSRCASGCPYLQQKDVRGPHVVFLSHAYLTVNAPIDRDYPVALRVVDEKVWSNLVRTSHIPLDELMQAPPVAYRPELRTTLSNTKAAVVDGLQRALPLHDHLASQGIRPEDLEDLVAAERALREPLEIGPWEAPQRIDVRIKTFDDTAFFASIRRQVMFQRLAAKPSGPCNGLSLLETVSEHGKRLIIEIADVETLPRDAPLLLLDADADPDITERIAPGAMFRSIYSPPVADIVQVADRTLSNSWLLDPEKGHDRRASVLGIVDREVAKAAGAGVLLVATKKVLAALHGDLGRPVSKDDDKGLRRPIHGADTLWFGPRTQGVNDYESYTSIVVVGRLQPGLSDIEAKARAVFINDTMPINTHEAGPLPAQPAAILMADDTVTKGMVHAHPDTRAQSILAQTRECGTLQAIARLRLTSPRHPKRVVILSSLPLPDFPVTRVVTFDALARDLELEPDRTGFVRMEKALRATMGQSVRGARLSAVGLAEDLPLDFETEDCAAGFRRGRPTQDLLALCRRVAQANTWPCTALLLSKTGGGKPVPAVVLEGRRSALSSAARLWPSLTANFA